MLGLIEGFGGIDNLEKWGFGEIKSPLKENN